MHRSIIFLAPLTAAFSFPKRDLSPPTSLPAGWEYNGCYTDSRYNRALNEKQYYDMGSNTVTAETCIAFCESNGFPVAGLEYSGECYCGSTLPFQSGTDGCNMPCAGDSSQVCGGPDRITVYSTFTTSIPEGWTSLGCYSDSVQARTLSDLKQVEGGTDAMTPELCTSTCQGFGFTYAGVEYAGECFCGNEIQNSASSSGLMGGCSMVCKGDGSELCGGPDRMNLYTVAATPEEPTEGEDTDVEDEPEVIPEEELPSKL